MLNIINYCHTYHVKLQKPNLVLADVNRSCIGGQTTPYFRIFDFATVPIVTVTHSVELMVTEFN